MIKLQFFNILLNISAKHRVLGFPHNLNITKFHRTMCYCKDENKKSSVKLDKNSKILRSNTPSSKRVLKYINNVNPEALQVLSTKYLKPCSITKRSISLCLLNESIAREFVNLFIDDIKKNSCHVIDANGGLGLMTKELLNAGIPVVYTFAKDPEFQNSLQTLQKQYPDRIHMEQTNIFQTIRHTLTSSINNTSKHMDFMKNVQPRQWQEDSCMQIIGLTIDCMIIKYLILHSIFKNSIMSKGRITFYLGILPSIWNELTYHGKNLSMYRFNNVLFELLFDSKLLGKLDRYSTLPWQRKKTCKYKLIRNAQNVDENVFYIVKIEPKVFNTGGDENELMLFYFFIRHHMIARTNRIIPELEKWIPDCGPRLIAKNYHVFTRFGDLSPNELWDLFKFFLSWPEIKNSNFILSAQTYFQNYDQGLTLKKENASVASNISNIYMEHE